MTTVERPVAVVIIAIVNVMIYVAVLSWVLPFLIAFLRYFPWSLMGALYYSFFGVAYVVAGIIGVVYLLRRWWSWAFRRDAMTGYAFECVLFVFAIIGAIESWLPSPPFYYSFFWPYVDYYQFIFGNAAAIAFKIASIVYLARKKT